MQAVQYKKSSIQYLLADSKTEDKVVIEPRTLTDSSKIRKLLRPKNPQFSLKFLQQPQHAKVTPPRTVSKVIPSFSEHRPVHPPPVLQLKLAGFDPREDTSTVNLSNEHIDAITRHDDPRSVERAQELKILNDLRSNRVPSWTHYSTFFIIARLQIQTTAKDGTISYEDADPKNELLAGSKVCSGMPLSLRTTSPSNSYLLKALPKEKQRSSNYAITFVFSDLAVTKTGHFRLKFDLFEAFNGKIQWRNMCYSDAFQVYTPKKFPGSCPSSPLTSFLFKHGARIRQRKRTFTKRSSKNDSSSSSSPFAESQSRQDLPNKRSRLFSTAVPLITPSTSSSGGSSLPPPIHNPYNYPPIPHQVPQQSPQQLYRNQHPIHQQVYDQRMTTGQIAFYQSHQQPQPQPHYPGVAQVQVQQSPIIYTHIPVQSNTLYNAHAHFRSLPTQQVQREVPLPMQRSQSQPVPQNISNQNSPTGNKYNE